MRKSLKTHSRKPKTRNKENRHRTNTKMSGKGDKQIKAQVPWQTYSSNWDMAFTDKPSLELVKARLNTELEQNSLVCKKATDTKTT